MKAEFSQSRNDMHWKYWTGKEFVRWSGYDDINWWSTVSLTPAAREQHVGDKTYTIDFNTCEVSTS